MFEYYESAKQLVNRTVEYISGERTPGGLLTGYEDLDLLTGGLNNGELVLLAGRPGMGKTGFVLSMLLDVCLRKEKTCLYFTLSESSLHLMKRMIMMESREHRVFTNPSAIDRNSEKEALYRLENSPLYINDNACTMERLKKCCNKLGSTVKIDLVVVDYYQILRFAADGKKADKRILEGLRDLAEKLDCPIIILSQLSRSVERRRGHRPALCDLKGTGIVLDYFDKVLLLYRDDYYCEDADREGKVDVMVARNTTGEIGLITLEYIKEIGVFEACTSDKQDLSKAGDLHL